MHRLILLLLIIPFSLSAEWDNLFTEDEDPTLFHHVNVITGNLNLCMQDALVEGAKPISIFRTYSSSGSLERNKGQHDLILRALRRGFLLQGGWSLFPHANLIIEPSSDRHNYKAYVPEKSGNLVPYKYSHRDGEYFLFLKPDLKTGQSAGVLSARTNPQNNLLQLNTKTGEVHLNLPDGGQRRYKGPHLPQYDSAASSYFYLLQDEILPSGHKINYQYDSKTNLKDIKLVNPQETRALSTLHFDYYNTNTPYHFHITTSDGKSIHYKAQGINNRSYMNEVISNCRPYETSDYVHGRRKTGERMRLMMLGGRQQFLADYYLPSTKKKAIKWSKDPKKIDINVDKVKSLYAPVGSQGSMCSIAQFTYEEDHTDVRDADNILTRYHHNKKNLNAIHFFNEHEELHSQLTFQRVGGRLQNKAKRDAQGQILFAKTFHYDALGNVTEEILWGNLTGDAQEAFILYPDGNVLGAESYRKTMTYYTKFNVPETEKEESGIGYTFSYKPNTDLLTKKLTYFHDKILIRECFIYNEDHLLIEESIDDGNSSDPQDFTGITQRHIKRYTLDPSTGMPSSIGEFYWDPAAQQNVLLRKIDYTYYMPQLQIHTETVYDANENRRYTLNTYYDNHGRVICKTTPSGLENTYHYDEQGNLLDSKEVGSPKKIFSYDSASRPVFSETISDDEPRKQTHTTYDLKSRILCQTDTKNNPTRQSYDAFGRCLSTRFCTIKDSQGNLYNPTINFTYDTLGNLASTTLPQGEITQTLYNSLSKPIQITQADGQTIQHRYHTQGTLARTTYPDLSEIHYTYDPFRRMTSKTLYSPTHELLAQENWSYSAFQLLSHTDIYGVTTTYSYDGAGRKIKEETCGRTITYTYDALGHLERTTQGGYTHVEIHDEDGKVIKSWDEDAEGTIENVIHFFYDQENRKEKAIRYTTQGDATDFFVHDSEGRLRRHTDPKGAVTEFIYDDAFVNDLNQYVLQKTTLDPLKNASIETYDALNHLIKLEKKNPSGQTVSSEEYTYDDSGNKIQRVTTLYHNETPQHTLCVTWKYDPLGRLLEENEEGHKITTYAYDCKGRLIQRTRPDQTTLFYTYDGLDRVTELKSSDGTVHIKYTYNQGLHPTEIIDLIAQTVLLRTYSPLGELLSETTPLGHTLYWEYDDRGRCIHFTLPDKSSIATVYSDLHLTHVQRYSSQKELLYQHAYTQFDCNGHVSQEELPHSLGILTTTHDLLERPHTQTSSWFDQKIEYGLSGLVTQIRNTLLGAKSYAYDSLNQLTREGGKQYHFDSVGNPTEYTISTCNQILSTPDTQFTYDPNGNPLERQKEDAHTLYTYDALGRLTSITEPEKKKILFHYDPLSRLLSKETYIYSYSTWQLEDTHYYLYNQEIEIGTIDTQGNLLQLKVLGLGIQGDIGATVAIEIANTLYVPLHDFNGNIIALVSTNGTLAEYYQIDAFGRESYNSSPRNPWRFCSKRSEEGFIFFGKRFYDPTVSRWLTPDPAGFVDGPNLYAYVRNSPLNRLDLFGMFSDDTLHSNYRIEIPINSFLQLPKSNGILLAKGLDNDTEVDLIIYYGYWNRLQFTPSELSCGKVNIVNHFSELISSEKGKCGLITTENGINNLFEEFGASCQSIINKIPEGTLFIGKYNATGGFKNDNKRLGQELQLIETSSVIKTRQFFSAICESIHKINPELIWLHIAHSEGVLIGRNAILGMTPEQQNILKKTLISGNLGGVQPMPTDYVLRAFNFYSEKDYAVKAYTKWIDLSTHEITFLPCISPRHERNFYFIDHKFLGSTYQSALQDIIYEVRKNFGFYDPFLR